MISRRGFLGLLGAAPVAAAAGELWVPGEKRIFLPPRGGWVVPLRHLRGLELTFDVRHEFREVRSWDSSIPLAVVRGPAMIEATLTARAEVLDRIGSDLVTLDVPGLGRRPFRVREVRWCAPDCELDDLRHVKLVSVHD